MNIISNNCFGGYIYKNVLKEQYSTPFIWNRIYNDDLIMLLKNFNKINFNNIELKKIGNNLTDGFYIIIDDLVKVLYNHYKFDINCNIPTLKDDITNVLGPWSIDIHYNKIWEYITDKYLTRVSRMDFNKPFVLALEDNKDKLDLNSIIQLAESLNFKMIIITKKDVKPLKNLMVLHTKFNHDFPGYFAEQYSDDIKNFLNS